MRLIAYLRLLRARPAESRAEHLILPIDRDQTGTATWGLTISIVAVLLLFVVS